MKAMVAVVLLVAQGQVPVFEGLWTDVPSNLKGLSGSGVTSGMTFAVTADQVKITDHLLQPDGRLKAFSNVYQTDGKPHAGVKPIKGLPDSIVIARWSGQHVLERGVHHGSTFDLRLSRSPIRHQRIGRRSADAAFIP